MPASISYIYGVYGLALAFVLLVYYVATEFCQSGMQETDHFQLMTATGGAHRSMISVSLSKPPGRFGPSSPCDRSPSQKTPDAGSIEITARPILEAHDVVHTYPSSKHLPLETSLSGREIPHVVGGEPTSHKTATTLPTVLQCFFIESTMNAAGPDHTWITNRLHLAQGKLSKLTTHGSYCTLPSWISL